MKPHLPHDLDAELGVLGAVLIRPETIALVPLEVDDFYEPKHKQVFGAMRNLEAEGKSIDTITVGDELERKDALAGGRTPLADACMSVMSQAALRVPTADRVEEYAEIIREHSTTRRLIIRLDEIILKARAGEIRGSEAVSAASAVIMSMDSGRNEIGKAMGQLVRDEFQAIERDADARDRGETVRIGVPTSLSRLDRLLGGIPVGVVTVLAGRPGNGKTTLAQTMHRAAAELTTDDPALYTYEDGGQSFAQREIAAKTGVPTQAIRSREFDYGQLGKIQNKHKQLRALRGTLIEAHGMPVEDVVRDVRRRRLRARSEGKSACGLVIVDYLQRMPMPQGNYRTDEKIGMVLDRLVTLAATERIAVVVCSQLNRETEKRENKRPMMSDLRDSGKIEELCKVLLGVYRPAKYEPNADPNLLEIHVLKNHQGEADVHAEVYWHMPTHAVVDSAVDLAGR